MRMQKAGLLLSLVLSRQRAVVWFGIDPVLQVCFHAAARLHVNLCRPTDAEYKLLNVESKSLEQEVVNWERAEVGLHWCTCLGWNHQTTNQAQRQDGAGM